MEAPPRMPDIQDFRFSRSQCDTARPRAVLHRRRQVDTSGALSPCQGPKRFGELQRETTGISKKMLTQVLRTLERRSLVDRQVFAEVPPHTEYSLTERGRQLHEPISALCDWALENMDLLDVILEADLDE